jgi:hypothetical protein
MATAGITVQPFFILSPWKTPIPDTAPKHPMSDAYVEDHERLDRGDGAGRESPALRAAVAELRRRSSTEVLTLQP